MHVLDERCRKIDRQYFVSFSFFGAGHEKRDWAKSRCFTGTHKVLKIENKFITISDSGFIIAADQTFPHVLKACTTMQCNAVQMHQ